MAMEAGKHVYVEKPCSHNPAENEIIVEFQKKYDKQVQMGNQQRSSLESKGIVEDIQKGIIGEAYKAVAFYINSRGEVPVPQKAAPPEGLDWDLFQGDIMIRRPGNSIQQSTIRVRLPMSRPSM